MDSTILDPGEDLSGFLASLGRPIDQTASEMIVFELYRRSLASSAKAAELVGISRLESTRHASDLGIPYPLHGGQMAGGSRGEQTALSAGDVQFESAHRALSDWPSRFAAPALYPRFNSCRASGPFWATHMHRESRISQES